MNQNFQMIKYSFLVLITVFFCSFFATSGALALPTSCWDYPDPRPPQANGKMGSMTVRLKLDSNGKPDANPAHYDDVDDKVHPERIHDINRWCKSLAAKNGFASGSAVFTGVQEQPAAKIEAIAKLENKPASELSYAIGNFAIFQCSGSGKPGVKPEDSDSATHAR